MRPSIPHVRTSRQAWMMGIPWQHKWYSKNKMWNYLQSTNQRNKLYPPYGPSAITQNAHGVARTSRQTIRYVSAGILNTIQIAERWFCCLEALIISEHFWWRALTRCSVSIHFEIQLSIWITPPFLLSLSLSNCSSSEVTNQMNVLEIVQVCLEVLNPVVLGI
jgi:hypothetical protein